MKTQGSAVKSAKRMALLDAQCGQLKEEKLKLKEQLLELEGKEKEMIDKYMKLKDKCEKVQEEFSSEKVKWREEEEILRENCRQEGVEKRKLEIDVKAAKRRLTNATVEVAQKLLAKDEHFQRQLVECNSIITTLLEKNEALDGLNARLQMDFEARMAMEPMKHEPVTEEKILELLQKIEVLEKQKGEFEAENKRKAELVVELEEEVKEIKGMEKMLRDKFDERGEQVSSLSGEIKALERQNSELESRMEPAIMKASELEKSLLDLKSIWEEEKRKIQEESNCNISTFLAKNEALNKRNRLLEMSFEARMEMEAKKQEAVNQEKILGLVHKIEVVEREKKEFKAENKKKDELIIKLEQEAKAITSMDKMLREKLEERGKQVSSLSGKIEDLERRNSKLESDIELVIMKASVLETSLLDHKSIWEEEKRKIREEINCNISTLSAENEALNKRNSMLEMPFEARMAMEAKKQVAVNQGKISGLLQKIEVVERDRLEFKAENKKKHELIIKLEEEAKAIMRMDKMLRGKLEERGKQVSSLSGEIEALERRNSKLECELELARMRAQELEKALLDLKSSWAEEKRKIGEESNCRIATLSMKNEALGKRTSMLEMEFEARMATETKKQEVVTEERILELLQKIVLDREKGELEAEFHKMKDDKSHETKENSNINKAFDYAKNILENTMKKMNELVERVGVLEREKEAQKRALEEEGKKKVSELNLRIEVLEKQREENEAKLCLANREKMGVGTEKRILEAETEKKALELDQRIVVLAREKKALETEFCREKRERSEKIKKVLNEKNILEREKQELEVETSEKDKRIKVLGQENDHLTGKKKKIGPHYSVVNLQDDMELPQRVHPARNSGISSTLTAQNHGHKSVYVIIVEPNVSLVRSLQARELLSSELRKRKVEGLGCFVGNEDGTKRCKLDVKHKLTFEKRQDMFNAFTSNDELCLRSVCALYRKYKCLGDWKDSSASTSHKGFKQPYEIRGMVLGKLLTSGGPEGTLKISLAELKQADPSGLQDCRQIAWNHYKELFNIYKTFPGI